jgi:uncharacterized protein YdhG (YjbR/CyaY superfamily)
VGRASGTHGGLAVTIVRCRSITSEMRLLTQTGCVTRIEHMSSSEIDLYLANLEEPKRSTLRRLRETILEVVPEAEQGISYQVPAFRIDGKVIAGFAAFKNHLSYLPHSGSVFTVLREEVASYKTSKGALQFRIDSPLPKVLVEHLVKTRVAQAFPDGLGR